MADYSERFFALANGLRLEARLYAGGAKVPAICLPGLTRNLRDFEDVAPQIAQSGRDVVALSLRGRGRSDADPDWRNYRPPTYAGDVLEVLDRLEWPRAALIGTSLGGLVAVLTNTRAPERVAGAVINDIGPELAPEGIARIVGYAGGSRPDAASLDEASAQIRAINEFAFPGRDFDVWRIFARRTFRESQGRWVLDYDQMIGKALTEAEPAGDLWPLFAQFAGKPLLVVRGAISDLLTPPIIEKMRAAIPGMDVCEVANVGHAPTLSEPEAVDAIGRFLSRIDRT